MLHDIDFVSDNDLLQWIRHSVETRSNILSSGNQGCVYLYENQGRRLIIKAPKGGLVCKLTRGAMLRNEHRAYCKLAGVPGVPRCYGMLVDRFLVLEFVPGVPIFKASIKDRAAFFEKLFTLIQRIHEAGVAHTDLRKKDNILVMGDDTPCIIDFGVAVVRQPGFAPLNHYLHRISRRFDYNAWVKLKYKGQYEQMTEADRPYFNRTFFEHAAAWLKSSYRVFRPKKKRRQ
jgi:predicted Ser/Thr protein kinase